MTQSRNTDADLATVYLVQEPSVPKAEGKKTLDISPLLWFGDVQVLVERAQSPSFKPRIALEQITERLSRFDPDLDYIAVAGGDTLGILLTGVALANLGHSHFRWLRFERARLPDGSRSPTNGSYTAVTVDLSLGMADLDA